MTVIHNATQVLASAEKARQRQREALRKSLVEANTHMRKAHQDNVPNRRGHAVGGFEGYAASGALMRSIKTTPPKQVRDGYESVLHVVGAKQQMYGLVHEYGKVIRAKRGPYLVFRVQGQWVRVPEVTIRRKRWFDTGKKRGLSTLPTRLALVIRTESVST